MALESATYIQSLASSNPPAGDPVSQAADHIRLIKSVLLSTFPYLTGPVAVTNTQLSLGVAPTGVIHLWGGSVASVPVGYGLCDGSTYARSDGSGSITTPDLRNRFVMGSGGTYAPFTTGGSIQHSHNIGVTDTALTVSQLPNFTIAVSETPHSHSVNDPGHNHINNCGPTAVNNGAGGNPSVLYSANSRNTSSTTGISINAVYTGITAAPVGLLGQVHSHTGSSDLQYNVPPYMALAYIMKL